MKSQQNSMMMAAAASVGLLGIRSPGSGSSSSGSSSSGSGSSSSSSSQGRVSKTPKAKDAVTEEMQLYFSKLKELVPFMPKNKKLSKLEIIQYVIDYICDLQLALEVHPASRCTTGNGNINSNSNSAASSASSVSPTTSRQPLGVLPAHSGLPNFTCAAQESSHGEKSLEELSTRPVSC